MPRKQLSSEFLDYLAATNYEDVPDQLPTLNDLSKQLGISVARLREQLEVAKALGLVEARPRTGLRRLPYSFLPAVRQSLAYAIEIDPKISTFLQIFETSLKWPIGKKRLCC
jgi:DNA-binding FadR family transcriptional regulator